MKSTSRTWTRHSELGLTLLEVLAATMIFAMVMTVLISTSTTAVHNVGVSARRLDASLLADEFLADLEIQMKQGIAPQVDESESARDQYSIRVVRTNLMEDLAGGDSGGGETSVAAMLGAGLPEVAKHLKQYDIEVSWFERNGPQRITRTTFAFDWQTAAIEYQELFQRSGGIGNSTAESGDGSGNGGSSLGGNNQSGSSNRSRFSPPRRIIYDGHNAARDRLLRIQAEGK